MQAKVAKGAGKESLTGAAGKVFDSGLLVPTDRNMLVMGMVMQYLANNSIEMSKIPELFDMMRTTVARELGEEGTGAKGLGKAAALAVGSYVAKVSEADAVDEDIARCMICGHESTVLTRHIKAAHGLTPRDYRKAFNLPPNFPLASKSYSRVRQNVAFRQADRRRKDAKGGAKAKSGAGKAAGKRRKAA